MLRPALTCQMALLLLHKVTDRLGTWLTSMLNSDIFGWGLVGGEAGKLSIDL